MNRGINKRIKLLSGIAAALMLMAFVISCKSNISMPKVAVMGVTLDKTKLSLEEAKTEKLTATVLPENATNKKITWHSDKPEVAEVDQNGKVTAKKTGTAKITVTTEDGSKTAECTVTVTAKAPSSVPTPKHTVTFGVEGTPANGTLEATVDGKIITSGSGVQKDKTVIFTAKPKENFEVGTWTIEGGGFVSGTGTDSNSTAKVTVTAAVTVKVSFKAKPEGTVKYTVEHWQQNVEGSDYTKAETERKYGKPNENTQAAAKVYEGFTAKPVTQQTIAVDGSTVVKIDYDRNEITLTLDLKGGSTTTTLTDGNKIKGRFGAQVSVALPTKTGYTFSGWNPALPEKFPAADAEYTAQWTPLYAITFGVEGSGGTLKAADGETEITSGNKVAHGKTVTFTATPDPGYEVKAWTKNGDPIAAAGTNSAYTHTVQADADIKVAFKPSDKTYTVNGINFMMKGIAAVTGKSVGHPDIVGYLGTNDNKPHSISLSAYRIGETEVTQELWQAVMGNNPSWFQGSSNPPESGEEQGKRPVENINWYHAIAFCNKLSKACGLEFCYTVSGVNFDTLHFNNIPKWDDGTWNNAVCDLNKNGFRLPTEAEWEWAAMGGTEDKWAGTNDSAQLGTYAWYQENGNEKTHQVKLKSPNGYGLYDMTGNVGEWCWDWYGSLSDVLPPNYTGAASGNMRVTRGGSWNGFGGYVLRAYRASVKPDEHYRIGGLRLVSRP